jgi:hypothetical protein
MKRLLLLTTAAVMTIAMLEPGLAASRDKNARDARAESSAAQHLDRAGRARTYGSPNDDHASGAWEYRYPQGYANVPQNAPYSESYGGPNGW